MLKRIGIIILIVLLIGVASVIFMMKSWNEWVTDANEKLIEDAVFSSVEVVSNNASVEIVPTSDLVTTVEYTGKTKKKSKYIFKADVKGDTLVVQFKEKWRGFFNFGSSSLNLKVTVKVPEKQYDRIQVETDNGRIKAENLDAEEIVLETDNGTIELTNIEADIVNVKTDNGKIILKHVEGTINGKTDNGTISLVTNNLDRPIELTTDNGRIEIQTDNEPTNATIDAKTDLGKIDILGTGNKHVTFGAGEYLIKLRTDNGRITVTK